MRFSTSGELWVVVLCLDGGWFRYGFEYEMVMDLFARVRVCVFACVLVCKFLLLTAIE